MLLFACLLFAVPQFAVMTVGNPLLVALFAALIPILAKWLMEWLNGRLSKSEAVVNKDHYQTETSHANAVLDHAIDDIPRRQIGRRLLLRFMRRHVDNPQAMNPEEMRDVIHAASND